MENLEANYIQTPIILKIDAIIISKIEKTQKIIKSMDELQCQLYKEIKEKKFDRDSVKSKLEDLIQNDWFFKMNMDWKKEKLDPLKLALDKLNFSNNAYQDDAIKSCIFQEEQEINFRKLHFLMLHGNKNLAAEKRFLKETNQRQDTQNINSRFLLEGLNSEISGRVSESYCKCFDKDWHSHNLEKIKHFKQKREKVIANAAVKGKIWNSLESKEAIQQKINLLDKESEEIRKKQLANRAEIKHIEKQLKAIEREINSLHKQNVAAYIRKDDAYKNLYLLRKQHGNRV